MKQILLFCLIALTTLSCVIQDHITPTDTCKLAQIVNGGGPNDFTYDATGSLTRWVITTVDPTGSDTYTSNRTDIKTDTRGYVTSVTLTYNDGYVGKTTYSLTGCQ